MASSEGRKCIDAAVRDITELRKSNFIEEGGDQVAAILAFLEQHHEKVLPGVPKIHEHYRQGA